MTRRSSDIPGVLFEHEKASPILGLINDKTNHTHFLKHRMTGQNKVSKLASTPHTVFFNMGRHVRFKLPTLTVPITLLF